MFKTILLLTPVFISFFSYTQVPDDYYNGTSNMYGEALKNKLNTIIDNHNELDYSECWDALTVLDRDPNNPDNIIGFYSRFSIPFAKNENNRRDWNREHIWSKSRGNFGEKKGAGTDLHHLRAADPSTNSARSNRSFDNCTQIYFDKGGKFNGPTMAKKGDDWTWQPPDNLKGDVARMMFYMTVRYEGIDTDPDLELTESLPDKSDKSPFHGKLSTLIAWHLMDEVDDSERKRNNLIFTEYQGNRNPFIDHPEFVELIWNSIESTDLKLNYIYTEESEDIELCFMFEGSCDQQTAAEHNSYLKMSNSDINLAISNHLPFGEPVNLSAENLLTLYSTDQIVGYDTTLRVPIWVSYKLTKEALYNSNDISRQDCFRADPRLSFESQSLCEDYSSDYRTFDRGHLAPNADQDRTFYSMGNSFLLSNIAPQYRRFNQCIWEVTESRFRSAARRRNIKNAYILTGSIFSSYETPKLLNDRVGIPDSFYKVLVLEDFDGDFQFMSVILTNSTDEIPFHTAENYIITNLCSIDKIEELTGIDFKLFPQELEAYEAIVPTALLEGSMKSNYIKCHVCMDENSDCNN